MEQRGPVRLDRRRFLVGGLSLAASIGLAACAGRTNGGDSATSAAGEALTNPQPDGDITWFTWAEYYEPSIITGFEERYGVKVNLDFFDSNDAMLQKLAAGQPYDVITNNSAYMERSIQGGLLRAIDLDGLENRGELLPYFEAPSYDNQQQRHSVPYSGGPTGMVYRQDQVEVTGSWDDLWGNAEAEGHIFVLDQIEETIGMALLRQGADLNSDDPEAVAAAVETLLDLKPRLGGISSDNLNNVANGTSWLSHCWSTDAFVLKTTSPVADRLGWQLGAEGTPFGMNCLTVGANANSPGTAMLFLDWILEPSTSQTNTRYLGDLTGTKTGDETYAEVMADHPDMQVPSDFYETAQWKQSLTGDRQSLWTQQWNRFKA